MLYARILFDYIKFAEKCSMHGYGKNTMNKIINTFILIIVNYVTKCVLVGNFRVTTIVFFFLQIQINEIDTLSTRCNIFSQVRLIIYDLNIYLYYFSTILDTRNNKHL